jgi:ubiquinone/menaquinone biosynthesis C-methylase UbiE
MPEPFTAEDGSAWWQRNADYLIRQWHPDSDWPCRLLEMYHVNPHTIIEVGCSGAIRLAHLQARYGARCIGVDISEQAIANGRAAYASLELHVADASSLPVEDGVCDVYIMHFVAHWLPRERLRDFAREADRVLRPNGVVLLADFAPDTSIEVEYKHRPGVLTYKRPCSYADHFPKYQNVARITWNHDTHAVTPDVPSEQRAAIALLRKES